MCCSGGLWAATVVKVCGSGRAGMVGWQGLGATVSNLLNPKAYIPQMVYLFILVPKILITKTCYKP